MFEMYEEMPLLVAQVRIVEDGKVHLVGDYMDPDIMEYDRLVFILAKEFIMPVGGWDQLPEPLFTDVMEKRD